MSDPAAPVLRPLLAGDVAARARAAVALGPLCVGCLGRLFAKVETGLTNEERGALLAGHVGCATAAPAGCSVCGGLLAEIPALAGLAIEALAPYELSTYLVGSKVDDDVAAREAELRAAVAPAIPGAERTGSDPTDPFASKAQNFPPAPNTRDAPFAPNAPSAPNAQSAPSTPNAPRAPAPSSKPGSGGPADTAEAITTHLNREIGKLVAAARPGVVVDFKDPQLTVVVDSRFDITTLQHGGLFLYGRYLKHERGIPQTIWLCKRCRGRGCVDCNLNGKMYPTSVQEIIAGPALEASGATAASFHGAGREDVDARCLGTGRPFVLELKDPRRRGLDLAALEAQVNAEGSGRVEARGLRFAAKAEVAAVKEFRGTKTYRAWVDLAAPVGYETFMKGIGLLREAPIVQRTPARVEHRRADKLRERRVLDLTVEAFAGTEAVLRITGDAGLYIKELVSGDEGRTKPSLAEVVGTAARVRDLDIVAVEYDDAA